MKTLITTLILLIVLLSGCSSIYLVEKTTGQEYILLKELPNLTTKDRVFLHWKTTYNSPFVKFNNRSGKFYYQINYNYSQILKK